MPELARVLRGRYGFPRHGGGMRFEQGLVLTLPCGLPVARQSGYTGGTINTPKITLFILLLGTRSLSTAEPQIRLASMAMRPKVPRANWQELVALVQGNAGRLAKVTPRVNVQGEDS